MILIKLFKRIEDLHIYFYSTNDLDFDEYDSSGKPKDGTQYEESVTVLLFNEKNKKSDVMEEYIES